ncbi:MAG: hypothetical protein ABIU09_00485 [Pyrinomonadaceae bacterium]
MLKPSRLTIAGLLLFVGSSISCAEWDTNETPAPNNTKVFPAQEVCGYPAKASAKIFHPLGVGTWSPISTTDARAGYNCTGAITAVQIYAPEPASIDVQYSASGTELGSTLITIKYSAVNVAENEPTYRTVFANFANDTLKRAFQSPLPDLMRKKMVNLATYSKPDKPQEETFFVGDGFVNLAREHDPSNSSITVTLRMFPDKVLKLEAGE